MCALAHADACVGITIGILHHEQGILTLDVSAKMEATTTSQHSYQGLNRVTETPGRRREMLKRSLFREAKECVRETLMLVLFLFLFYNG